MENLDLSMNGPPTFSIVLSSDSVTNGSIIIPGTGYIQSFSVGASTSTEIFLPDAIYYPIGDESYSNTGIKVVADHPISLYAFHNRAYFSEATLVLPSNELGTDYIIVAHDDDGVQGGSSELVIEGTADSTEVEITPSVFTLSARPPGIPFVISLNEGQLFQLQAYGDLTGTQISTSDQSKKIAVFSGIRWGEIWGAISNCSATSHTYDQNYPVDTWGDEYILVPFSGQGGDPFRVIASVDQTEVYFDGVLKATLNSGEHFEQVLTATTYFTSSNPVAVVQFSKGGTCSASGNGDPSMVILAPLSFTEMKSIFKSVNTFSTPLHFVNIVCTNDAASSMTLDGTNISSAFNSVAFNSAYSFAKISLLEGSHILQSDRGFQAIGYGFGFYNAYSFNTGFGEPNIVGINNPSSVAPTFGIFPNPMKDECYFRFQNISQFRNNELQLRIYSIQGELLRNENVNVNVLSLLLKRKELKAGVYFCELFSGKQLLATKKLIVE
ncbi:MAG: T9SS type A sorting domain-containing protein [Chitinophagales bacterium]|nr:T9SS type A sorting domain-containing protein [Chitinophagales bacterium]